MEHPSHFPHLVNNTLLELLKEAEFASSLAYLVDFRNHDDLEIIPREHSIEVSNSDITISIIVYAGYEGQEYHDLKNRKNVHVVCLSDIILEMCEFENLPMKYIDKMWISQSCFHNSLEYTGTSHHRVPCAIPRIFLVCT